MFFVSRYLILDIKFLTKHFHFIICMRKKLNLFTREIYQSLESIISKSLMIQRTQYDIKRTNFSALNSLNRKLSV